MMRSPAIVFLEKEREKDWALPGVAPATVCTEAEADIMVTVSVEVPVPAAFVAVNVTVEAPAALGVPEIKPFAVLTDKPAGNPVAP